MNMNNRAFAQTQIIQARIVKQDIEALPVWFTDQIDINLLKKLTFADIYKLAIEQPKADEAFDFKTKATANTMNEESNRQLLNLIQEVLYN